MRPDLTPESDRPVPYSLTPKAEAGLAGDRAGHARAALSRSRGLRREMEAGYSGQAAIKADYERIVAAQDAADARVWAQMSADGVAVAEPEAGL